jgi:hypothetical protein
MEYIEELFEDAINHYSEEDSSEALYAIQALYLAVLDAEKSNG